MKTIRIKNHRASLVVLPRIQQERDDKGVRRGRSVPGVALEASSVTPVDADYWAKIVAREDIAHMIAVGMIEPLKADDASGAPAERDTLRDLKVEAALVHVNACEDHEQLMSWAGKETRKPVMDALLARIEHVENKAKKAGLPAKK